jgi:hypothetical protein
MSNHEDDSNYHEDAREDEPLAPERSKMSRMSTVRFVPQFLEDYLENDPDEANLATNHIVRDDGGSMSEKLEFKFQPESCRFIAYLGFWTMCILAILLTRFVVSDRLEEGPSDPSDTCPPFETGEGFNIYEDSHLIRAFGFNNVSAEKLLET